MYKLRPNILRKLGEFLKYVNIPSTLIPISDQEMLIKLRKRPPASSNILFVLGVFQKINERMPLVSSSCLCVV